MVKRQRKMVAAVFLLSALVMPLEQIVCHAKASVQQVRSIVAEQDVAGAEEDVTGAEEDVAGAKEDVTEAEEDVTEAEEDVAGAEEDVTEAEKPEVILELKPESSVLQISDEKYLLLKEDRKKIQIKAACTISADTTLNLSDENTELYLVSEKTGNELLIQEADFPKQATADIVSGSALGSQNAVVCNFLVDSSKLSNGVYHALVRDRYGQECRSAGIRIHIEKAYTAAKTLEMGDTLKVNSLKKEVEAYYKKYHLNAGKVVIKKPKKVSSEKNGKILQAEDYGNSKVIIWGTEPYQSNRLGTIQISVVPKEPVVELCDAGTDHRTYSGYTVKRIQISSVDSAHLKKLSVKYKKDNGEYKPLQVTIKKTGAETYMTGDFAVSNKGSWTFRVLVSYKGCSEKLETDITL